MSAPTAVLFDVPGPKARVRHRILAVVGSLLLLALLAFIIVRMLDLPAPDPAIRQRNNQFEPQKWLPFIEGSTWVNYLLPGLAGTLVAAAVSVVLSLLFGLALGIGRLVQVRWVRWACGIFVEFFRSVPVLMMMLFAYYAGLFALGITGALLPFFGVVVGLTLYNSCVIAELIRSGVYSLPKGQEEAGLALGLTPMETLTTIRLPQAITAMLPSMLSQLVVILKDSALGYMISYLELMRAGTNLAAVYGNLIPTMLVLAVMYIIMNSLLTRAASGVQRRLRRAPQVIDLDVTGGMVPQAASEPQVPATLMPPPASDAPPTIRQPGQRRHRRDPQE